MAIPELDPATGYLPPGNHTATWTEVEAMFGKNYGRRLLLANLAETVKALRGYGVSAIWLDGSFVTDKLRPRDVEVVYRVPPGADNSTWGLYAPANHDALKRDKKIDLWAYPSPQPGPPLGIGAPITILEFFSRDRSDILKGLIRLAPEAAT